MEMRNRPLIALVGVAVVCVLAALVLFALANQHVGGTFNLDTGEKTGGVPVWAAFIPLTVGIAALIGAGAVWATAASRRGTPETDRSYRQDAPQTTASER